MEHIRWKLNLHENSCKPQQKSHIIHEKIAYIDDMMIHNLVKYLLQTQLRLLFLYLINEVEFGHNILQGCVSSYHLHV